GEAEPAGRPEDEQRGRKRQRARPPARLRPEPRVRPVTEEKRRVERREVRAELEVIALKRRPRCVNDEYGESEENRQRLDPPEVAPRGLPELALDRQWVHERLTYLPARCECKRRSASQHVPQQSGDRRDLPYPEQERRSQDVDSRRVDLLNHLGPEPRELLRQSPFESISRRAEHLLAPVLTFGCQ